MADKNRGKRPKPSKGAFGVPAEPVNHDDESPKFCLHFLRTDFDVHALDARRQAAFAKALQKLASSRWKELITAPRHGQGTEQIPRGQIRAPIPLQFQDQEKFLVFRYDGVLPMAGVRVRDVFHVLWIEPEFGRLYDHGLGATPDTPASA
jgi:hypothetical protein